MIALIWLLAVLSVANGLEELPTRGEIESSINRTIDEVERLVRSDPSLPRLSRKQIVDILFKITATDMKSYEESVEKTREDYERALMIVLPFSSNETKAESLKELYTKAPLVKIVKDSPGSLDQKSNDQEKRRGEETKRERESNEVNRHDNHRDTYTEVKAESPTQESLRILLDQKASKESAPQKFSFNLDELGATRKKEASSGGFFKNFLTRKSSPKSKSDLEIVYSTSVTQRPTTRLTPASKPRDQGFRPTMPPTRSTENLLTQDQWRYNAPPSPTTSRPRRPSVGSRDPIETTSVPFLPTMMPGTMEKDEDRPSRTPQGPGGSSWNMKTMGIVEATEEPVPVYVTPMTPGTSTKPEGPSTGARDPGPTTKIPMHMREEVQDLLASIGLQPGSKENDGSSGESQSNVIHHEKIFGSNFQMPESSNLIPGPTAGLTAAGIESPSISSQNTFEKTPQDVKKGVENLSPDVQLLFQRFGLQHSAREPVLEVTTQKPRVSTKATFWNNFKPLPTSQVKDEGMREFLAKFGLGIEDRKEKSMTMRSHSADRKPSLIEAVPANMKGILQNIGLITRSQKTRETPRIQTTESPQLHVFKPHETSIENEKQRAKINQLLDTVKLVQEGKADVAAVQSVAKELLESTKTLKNGPDPLSLEEILTMYNNDLKNEIKRQQDRKDLEDVAVTEISNSTSTTRPEIGTSTAEAPPSLSDSSAASSDSASTSNNSTNDSKDSGSLVEAPTTESSNLDSLADSFGGTTSAPDPVLPTPRKTGLYFLVDWNTFLEVGEEDMGKVNLRFQPKAGDRTRFIPVTVP
ncbi:uncharacterized protein [Venturia canescens]|uniref:uncharacterized protein n=1 Tax=Venturia canescens TaxID=32260 RepID=UPI001C9D156A|nr:uncharacterized protein LOC122418213 [Venturia canescens]